MNVLNVMLHLVLVNVVSGKYWDTDRRAVMEEFLPELYKLYKQGFQNDIPAISRRFLRNTTEYILHVEKLKEVGGLKAHNLRVEQKDILRRNPNIIYIINPLESHQPNAFITEDEFKIQMEREYEDRNKLVETEEAPRKIFTLQTSTTSARFRKRTRRTPRRVKRLRTNKRKLSTTKLHKKIRHLKNQSSSLKKNASRITDLTRTSSNKSTSLKNKPEIGDKQKNDHNVTTMKKHSENVTKSNETTTPVVENQNATKQLDNETTIGVDKNKTTTIGLKNQNTTKKLENGTATVLENKNDTKNLGNETTLENQNTTSKNENGTDKVILENKNDTLKHENGTAKVVLENQNATKALENATTVLVPGNEKSGAGLINQNPTQVKKVVKNVGVPLADMGVIVTAPQNSTKLKPGKPYVFMGSSQQM